MAMLKSEYQYQYYRQRRRPVRDLLFARLPELGSRFPSLVQAALWFTESLGGWLKPLLGIHKYRPLPGIHSQSLTRLARDYRWNPERISERTVILLADEFTDLFDPSIGRKAIFLLETLDLEPMLSPPMDSCRAQFSKGFLKEARRIVDRQIHLLGPVIEFDVPLIGIEPSAILGIPDEWIKVCSEENVDLCRQLASRSMTIEEFLFTLLEEGRLSSQYFETKEVNYHVHGHCHFKAQVEEDILYHLLSVLPGSAIQRIPSGCCGMAGSFGYEKEHYDLSRSIGELVLFPYLRKISDSDVVVANGISCRHQIRDMMDLKARHPVEVLYERLRSRAH